MEEAVMEEIQKPMAAIIQIDSWNNHPERHGAMFDLAASEDVEFRKGETKVIPLGIRMKLPEGYFGLVVPRSSTCLKHGIMMANSVGIIEPDYCGDGDVWGFVAYAIRDTWIEAGTRIAQFMPVKMPADVEFENVASMPYNDRGGYGSTGDKSELEFLDANGCVLEVGSNVCELPSMDANTVKELYSSGGRLVAVLEDGRKADCSDLELDDRPRDWDGVPIDVGDVLYIVRLDGEPEGKPLRVEACMGEYFVSNAEPYRQRLAVVYTHREPDSFEKIAEDASLTCFEYTEKHGLSSYGTSYSERIKRMQDDLLRRMKAVAARG